VHLVTRVVIVAHHLRDDARKAAITASAWLSEHGHKAWMAHDDAAHLDLPELGSEESPDTADLVLSLGGDGTMLRAVGLLDGAPVPLLGVNLGRLGYLTEVEVDGMVDALQRFVAGPEAGGWHLDRRMMLDVDVRDGDGAPRGRWCALNEAVVEKRTSGQTVELQVLIDGEPFTSYAADGLIVSTPTGSTAYSFSARGPVVSPKHRAVLVTPVAPHMLFDRSLLLDPSETVEIQVRGDRQAAVVIDGHSRCQLSTGAIVRCEPSDSTADFVRFGGRYYHQVLKAKFGLTDR
jgi:NAD+ kinase